MTWGVLERNMNVLKAKSATNKYQITLDMVTEFILESQKSRLDAHILVGGQNGMGKSYYQLAQAKSFLNHIGHPPNFVQAEKSNKLQFFYAYHTREDLRDAIRDKHQAVFIIDELRTLFDYKRSMSAEQTELYNMVEVGRSHGNVFIGASRDYTKLDINYRNAKAQLLIYLIDKVVDYSQIDKDGCYKTKFTYGGVFIGNPALEHEDKFLFSNLRGYSIETTKYLAEKLPTWIGNIVVKHVSHYGVTPDDIALYETGKEKGISDYSYKRKEKPAKVAEWDLGNYL